MMEPDVLKPAAPLIDHAEAILLLPFYATGVLDATERQSVDSHLQSCIACRRELANERRTQRAFQQSEPFDAMVTQSYQRMSALLDAPAAREEIPGIARRPARVVRWIAVAMAASVAAILVGGVGLWTGTVPEAPGRYRTLALQEVTAYRIVADAQVVFRHGLSPADAQAALAAEGLDILSGPSAIGAYSVRRHAEEVRPLQQVLASVAMHPEVLRVYPNTVAGEHR